MKEKVVFEYSRLERKFNKDNPNNRKNLELIYDKGIDNVEILAKCTDINKTDEQYSKEMEYFFKLLEINKGFFIEYCAILETDEEVSVALPKDDKIVNDKKLLAKYWNREAFIQACPKLLQILIEQHNPFLENKIKLYATNEYNKCGFSVWIDKNDYNKLFKGETGLNYSKFTTIGEELFSFPRKLMFEAFVPNCAMNFAINELQYKDKFKDAIEHPEKTLNLNNYIVIQDY